MILSKAAVVPATGNRLLDCLGDAGHRDAVRACCERVSLRHGQQLYRQGGHPEHVYFPIDCVCSSVVRMSDGKQVEATTVGNEGAMGVPAYLVAGEAIDSALVEVPGEAWRLATPAFWELTRRIQAFDSLVRRYLGYRLRYAHQTIACNALHSVEERASRWLLMTQDRVGKDDFSLTHEFLAAMLGTHRQTVSVVAATLQRAGFIQYRRGLVRVVSREQLEEASCECYAVVKQLYERLIRCP